MRVTSSKPKGQRIFKSVSHKYRINGHTFKMRRPLWIEPKGNDWWFYLETGQWLQGKHEGRRTSSYYAMSCDGYNDVYSLKAAKRLIAKWNVPKGTKFRVSLPFVGYVFYLTKP